MAREVHALQIVVMFVCFILYNESTAVTEKCVGLQNSFDVGETVPSVCSGTCLTVSADGSEVSDVRVEEFLHTQEEEDHLAVALPAVKAADTVCYVCNIVVLTVVQVCTVASAFWQCVVWCLGVTLQ
jgi:hypothetical protein